MIPTRLRRRCAVAAAVLLTIAAAPASAADVTGYWATNKPGSIVEILPCGERICGRLVTLRSGGMTTDLNNKDADKRDRPLCQLMLMTGFTRTSDTTWEEGSIYDPESGNTYAARMTLTAPDKLDLRGYIGIPLFGRTETWRRAEAPASPCG